MTPAYVKTATRLTLSVVFHRLFSYSAAHSLTGTVQYYSTAYVHGLCAPAVLARDCVNCGMNISNYATSVVVRLSHLAVQRSRKTLYVHRSLRDTNHYLVPGLYGVLVP